MAKDTSNWTIEQHLSYAKGVVEGLIIGTLLAASGAVVLFALMKSFKG